MKIVIQCAGGKKVEAGWLSNSFGKRVHFVAHPEKCSDQMNSCHPDDRIERGGSTWREFLKAYNQNGLNPNRLYRAGDLYKHRIYKELAEKYGWLNVFILSAGWGLIRSDFLVPYYDITFSDQAKPCNKRRPRDQFEDFNQLLESNIRIDETIYFFGGQHYLPLYLNLTREILSRKVIYHSRGSTFQLDGYECIPYGSFTNWHYSCAHDFMENKIPL